MSSSSRSSPLAADRALQPPPEVWCRLSCLQQYQQRFAEAIEEAKELWDRRNGRDPTTSHNPPNFLDPDYGACKLMKPQAVLHSMHAP